MPFSGIQGIGENFNGTQGINSDYNPHPHNDINYKKRVIRVLRHAISPAGDPNPQARLGAGRYPTRRLLEQSLDLPLKN